MPTKTIMLILWDHASFSETSIVSAGMAAIIESERFHVSTSFFA